MAMIPEQASLYSGKGKHLGKINRNILSETKNVIQTNIKP